MKTDATLTVHIHDDYGTNFAAAKKIAGPFMECFDPVDVCSTSSTAMLMRLGGDKNAHTEETVKVVRKRREKYADILAKEIAAELVKAMESKDTRNGYRKGTP